MKSRLCIFSDQNRDYCPLSFVLLFKSPDGLVIIAQSFFVDFLNLRSLPCPLSNLNSRFDFNNMLIIKANGWVGVINNFICLSVMDKVLAPLHHQS